MPTDDINKRREHTNNSDRKRRAQQRELAKALGATSPNALLNGAIDGYYELMVIKPTDDIDELNKRILAAYNKLKANQV